MGTRMQAEKQLVVKQPSLGDIRNVCEHLDEQYRREIEKSCLVSPEKAIQWSVNDSTFCRAVSGIVSRGEGTPEYLPVAIFGVCRKPEQPQVGIAWWIGTIHEKRFARHILGYSQDYLAMMADSGPFRSMENHVLSENDSCLRFVDWLGFHVEPAEPYGPYGAMFNRVVLG